MKQLARRGTLSLHPGVSTSFASAQGMTLKLAVFCVSHVVGIYGCTCAP